MLAANRQSRGAGGGPARGVTHFRRPARAPNRGVLRIVARRDDDGLGLVDAPQLVEQATKQRRLLNGRQRARVSSPSRVSVAGTMTRRFVRAASIPDIVLN